MKEFLLSNQKGKIERYLFYLFTLFLPTQLGRHFWPDFSSVLGIRVDYLSPTIYFTDVLVFMLFVLWSIRSLSGKINIRSFLRRLSTPLIPRVQRKQVTLSSAKAIPLFVCILIFNVATSGHIASGLYSSLKLLEMSFVAYYIAKFIREKTVMQKIITFFCIGVIFQSLLAIAQYVQQGSIGGFLYFLGERYFNASTPGIANASLAGELILRPYGTFPHPNVLAGYLLIVITLVAFSVQKNDKQIAKKLKYICLFLGTIALFLTMSRIAILLWALVAIYYFLIHTKKRLPIFIFAGLIILFFLSPLGARFTKVNITDEAVLQRKVLIESAISMIKANPYFGVGFGNFLPTLAKIQSPLSLGLYLQPVHNIFLLIAAEIGLIGLGIFIWFLFKTLKHLIRNKEKILIIILSEILILGLFDHYWLTLQQGQLLFVYALGLCWASPKIFPSARVEKF